MEMKKDVRAMKTRIIAERPQTFRTALPFGNDQAVVVFDDNFLYSDPDYAPGVLKSLVKAWDKGDYFMCVLFDAKGEQVDSVCGMAGYGGPVKAARAAMQDYWDKGTELQEKTDG